MTTQIKAGVIAANAVNSSELASGALSGQNFTGDVIFDTTTLKIDSSNNRVGIGTTSPTADLSVGSTSTSSGDVHLRTTKTAFSITPSNTDAGGILFDLGWVNGGQGPMKFGINGSEKMRIDSSGNLIMTAGGTIRAGGVNDLILDAGESGTPDIYLQSGGATKVKIEGSNGNVGIGETTPDAPLHITSTTPIIVFDESDASQEYRIGSFGGAFALYDSTDAAYRLTVDGSGNVGIGTTSPSRQLTLYTTSNISYNSSSMETSNLDLYMRNADTTVNNHAGIQFAVGNNSDAAIACVRTSDANAALTFGTRGTGSGNIIEKMRIDSSGNVGIGTTGPVTQLDVRGVVHVGASASTTPVISRSLAPAGSQGMFITAGVVNGESVTTPTFADNSSSGASIYLGGNAADQYGGTVAIKAYGTGSDGNLIIFENRSGTNTFTERMRIDTSGNLIVGKTAANLTLGGLYVSNNDFMAYTNTSTDTGDRCLILNRQNGTGELVDFRYQNSSVGKITHNGSQTSYGTGSDYRLKENVEYDFTALDRVAQLKPARFNFIADADTTVDGFIAHEVQDIVPEAVTGEKDAVDDEGNPVMQGIDQSKLVPLLTKAIQEQQTIINDLKSRIETLEG